MRHRSYGDLRLTSPQKILIPGGHRSHTSVILLRLKSRSQHLCCQFAVEGHSEYKEEHNPFVSAARALHLCDVMRSFVAQRDGRPNRPGGEAWSKRNQLGKQRLPVRRVSGAVRRRKRTRSSRISIGERRPGLVARKRIRRSRPRLIRRWNRAGRRRKHPAGNRDEVRLKVDFESAPNCLARVAERIGNLSRTLPLRSSSSL